MAELWIDLRNELSEISRLSEEIESFGARQGLSPTVLFQLNLALEEVVTNVVSYGFDDGKTHTVRVQLVYDGQVVRARVEDDGVAFNPLEVPPPDVEVGVDERKVGGLGMHLVRELMDDVAYARANDRNVLTMQKHLAD